MLPPYKTTRRVEFRDTDAAGIMHFSTFFTYMEEVEHELLRALGTSVVLPLEDPQSAGKVSWPRVAAECQYHDSARFEEQLEIEVWVSRMGTSSVTYAFRFRVDQRAIATGSMTSVCCRFLRGKPPQPISVPEPLRSQLSELVLP